MYSLLRRFLSEDDGFLISAEMVLVVTILVIGGIVGLNNVSTALNKELGDLANSYQAMSQSYYSSGYGYGDGYGNGYGGGMDFDPYSPYGNQYNGFEPFDNFNPGMPDIYGDGFSIISPGDTGWSAIFGF
jgi:hypothetical protein